MSYEKLILQQDLGFVRPKYVVQEGLKKKIAELGPDMMTRFDVSLEYPKRETQGNTKEGKTEATRKIVVKKVTSSPAVQGIGQIFTAETFRTGEDLQSIMEAEGIGQVDNHTIEISVWTPDSKDRDLLIDLIKIWMLELTHTVEQSSGLPFFLRRGIFSVNEVRNYEGIDRNSANVQFNTGIIVYNFLVPFYGTHVESLEKIKFNIINNLVTGGTGSNTGTVIVDTNAPIKPPGGGGGGGIGGGTEVVGSTDETSKVPDEYKQRDEFRPSSGGSSPTGDIVRIPDPKIGSGNNNDIVVVK